MFMHCEHFILVSQAKLKLSTNYKTSWIFSRIDGALISKPFLLSVITYLVHNWTFLTFSIYIH